MRRVFWLLCILLSSLEMYAQSITVTGNWTIPNFNAQKPVEAGSDYNPNYIESTSNETLLNVNNAGILLPTFHVAVTGPTLPSGLTLQVRRTGGGTAINLLGANLGILLGNYTGTPLNQYLTLTPMQQPFFSFSGVLLLASVNNIPVQYRLEGLSALLPVNAYSLTVTYTVSP